LYPNQITGFRPGVSRFQRYDAAVLGFEGYWWPVMFSSALRERKPVSIALFGSEVMFFREAGVAHALEDRCPHRGVPISTGRQEFRGSFTCGYHGWTFDLKSGVVVAALTDGADSPICGKARVRVFPVAERAGVIWIYHGEGTPPPVETHIPDTFLAADAVVEGRVTERKGDWRYAAENGFDHGHSKYLHRNALFVLFRRLPGSNQAEVIREGDWITLIGKPPQFQSEFPGLGTWPTFPRWKRGGRGPRISIRLPAALRVDYGSWVHFEWYVPTTVGEHRYLQFAVRRARGLAAWRFRAKYRFILSWIFHGQFNDQDARIVELMRTPPEQLYRPDNSLVAWRHLCEEAGNAAAQPTAPIESTVLQSEIEGT
jgi:phenylpropionate dioxygenase-like ring-hydroxylating dioxygenase large terminal subunit